MSDALTDPRGLPDTIYKFRPWGKCPSRCLLRSREIFFACHEKFNDPFDCTTEPSFQVASEEKLKESAARQILLRHPNESIGKRRRLEQQLLRELPREQRLKEIGEGHKTWKRCAGIFSASLEYDEGGSNLLWSHYAGGHKGYCVGLNLERVMECVFDAMGVNALGPYYMDYNEAVPSLSHEVPTSDVDDMEKLTDFSFMHKSLDWSYEREFRLVVYPPGFPGTEVRRKYTISEECIESVVMGCECEHIEAITRIVDGFDSPTVLLKAVRKPNSFRLEYDKAN